MSEPARSYEKIDRDATRPELSVVIPAYNEENKIGVTLRRTDVYLSRSGGSYEIIVVDDGSTDGTPQLVRRLSESMPSVRLLSYSPNKGKGYAVKQGVALSRGLYVLMCDADLSTPIEEAGKLLGACREDADLAFGSRATVESDLLVQRSFIRKVMSRVFNVVVRVVALPDVGDSQCGFKCMKGDTARTLFADQVIDGFAFDVELIMRAKISGLRAVEMPVRWLEADSSSVRPLTDSLAMVRDVIRLRRLLGRSTSSERMNESR